MLYTNDVDILVFGVQPIFAKECFPASQKQ